MIEFVLGAASASILYFAFPALAVWVNGKIAQAWAAINKPRE